MTQNPHQTAQFNFRISTDTRRKLKTIAARSYRSQSQVVRLLIDREYARLQDASRTDAPEHEPHTPIPA